MSSTRTLNLFERGFLSAMGVCSRMTEGYTVSFTEELVRQHGILGFFKWARSTMREWKALVDAYGERDAHLLAAFASFWNGCDYCAYGHVLAHNLHVFQESGALFPVDEQEVPALTRERDEELLTTLRQRLSAPEQAKMLGLLERQYALKFGLVQAETEEDRTLARTNALYDWVNECSITVEAPSPPLGRIAKERKVRREYDVARQQSRAATLPPSSPPARTAA